MKKNLRRIICSFMFFVIVACSASVSPHEGATSPSPLSLLSFDLKLMNAAAMAFAPQSNVQMSSNNELSQENGLYRPLEQASIDQSVSTSIFAIRENRFKPNASSGWQPMRIFVFDKSYPNHDWLMQPQNRSNTRSAEVYVQPSGEVSYVQTLPAYQGKLVYRTQTSTDSVGVQFYCKQSCGWAQIRVDGEIRWIGNTYNMDDYVEIFRLPYDHHDVEVESLDYSDGERSDGVIRILAFGEGVLHRIYLPIISK